MGIFDSLKKLLPKKEEKPIKKFEIGSYSVNIIKIEPTKMISSIKNIKEIVGLGIKDIKDIVSNLPGSLITGISKFDAESIKEKLEQVGIKAEVVKKN